MNLLQSFNEELHYEIKNVNEFKVFIAYTTERDHKIYSLDSDEVKEESITY